MYGGCIKSWVNLPSGSNAAENLVSEQECRHTNDAKISQRREHVQIQEIAQIEAENSCSHNENKFYFEKLIVFLLKCMPYRLINESL